uniref:Uncharacterized protein n=1 Tax=Siphoviridae sp. cttDR14 TaxID=2826490 RepID=A0A8S5M2M6_9CAUD|nr:MAG TPA: hypothetical protein [Siphoviridae sp. cttDR14]
MSERDIQAPWVGKPDYDNIGRTYDDYCAEYEADDDYADREED